MNLLVDKNLFDKFLSEKQKILEKDEILKSQLKYQACVNLKNALETSINKMITNNKSESKIRFDQIYDVNFVDCGLNKDIRELKNIVKEKTGFKLKIYTFLSFPFLKNYWILIMFKLI